MTVHEGRHPDVAPYDPGPARRVHEDRVVIPRCLGRALVATPALPGRVVGHEPALPRGGAGILVDGEGSIRLESLVVTPIDH